MQVQRRNMRVFSQRSQVQSVGWGSLTGNWIQIVVDYNNKQAMRSWSQIRKSFQQLAQSTEFKSFIASPVTKILGFNTVVFVHVAQWQLMWRLKLIPESLMVKHFSFDKFNLQEGRYHTLVTHAFSHFGLPTFLINMFMIGSFGRAITRLYGNKVMYLLAILGAGTGGLFMTLAKPPSLYVMPEVGADSILSCMFTFYGMMNLQQRITFFFFPMPMWGLLVFLSLYSMLEPSKKSFGGIMAGLMIYQMFRFRMI